MSDEQLRLFALSPAHEYGERVARALGVALSPHEERHFEDGEHKTRPLESVRECDVYVFQSLSGDDDESVNDRLCRLLFFIGALKDAAAARVTAVVPYLCYARKDRKTKPRDPVTTRYVALLLEAVGTDRVVTIDAHNLAAFQNAFRCPTEHLEARLLFARHLAPRLGAQATVVVAPDAGGIKRAERFRDALAHLLDRPLAMAFMEKRRSAGVVSGETFVGAVEDAVALIVDDLISTGGTLVRTAKACKELGATRVCALATHGAFAPEASGVLADTALDEIIITDTIAPRRLGAGPARDKLTVLDAAPLLAEAVGRIHGGGSMVELLELPDPPA